MNERSVKTMLWIGVSLALTVFLTYIFVRIKMASGLPVVHTVWGSELTSLVKTIARSVQLLGVLAGSVSLITVLQTWKNKQPFAFPQMLQACALCGVSFITPDVAKMYIPILLGVAF